MGGIDIRYLVGFYLILDRPLQPVAGALQESLPVAEALVLRVKPAIDEIRYALNPRFGSGFASSTGLVHLHVPIDQSADLACRIATLDHPLNEFVMCCFSVELSFLEPKLMTGSRSST